MPDSIKILSWNVEHFKMGKTAEVAQIIQGHDPDVFALYEVEAALNAGGQAGGFSGVGNGTSYGILHHELGHALMQMDTHYTDSEEFKRKNFFHELAEYTDDTILPFQVLRMRGEAITTNYFEKVE